MRLIYVSMFALLLGGANGAWALPGKGQPTNVAQQQQSKAVIKGRVVDAQGEGLPGVTIRMKDFKGGYISIQDGTFEILTSKPFEVVTFTMVGFQTKELKLTAGSNTTVVLNDDVSQISEVVVTGFGTKSKTSYTGSQISVSRTELLSMGTKNLLESLQSFVPGLAVLENNEVGSDPNKRNDINIRGRASFDGSANLPVFVVDGTQVSIDFIYDMDMNDIETVTVLKDASASALYGAKASAGVIVITTKSLKGGRLKLNYSGTYRLSAPDLSDYHLLNAAQKLEYERLAGVYKNALPSEQYKLEQEYARLYGIVQSGVNTDWKAKPLRNAFSNTHSLSVDGGDEYARYNVGVRYSNEQGVMKGSKRERLSSFFKLSYNINGLFYVSNSSTISSVKSEESPYGGFSDWTKQNPYESPYDENGDLRTKLTGSISNPLYEASLGSYDRRSYFDFLNTTNVQYWLRPQVRLDADFSFQKAKTDTRKFVSPLSFDEARKDAVSQRGSLTEGFGETMQYQGKLMASYNDYVKEKLYLSTMVGGSIESVTDDNRSYRSIGFYTDKLGHPAFAGSYPTSGKPSGSDGISRNVGVFANVNAIYDSKYFLDLIYRYEGSSKFGDDRRFAPFWSVGGGWNIHNEPFMKGKGVSLLKLRGSLGYLGNISFEPYQAMTTYTYSHNYNYEKGMGAVPITVGNTALGWERTLSTNFGVDLTMLKGRLDLSADVYRKYTDNLLLTVSKAPSVGIENARENIGAIQNVGFELRARVVPLQTKDINWSVAVTYSMNRNKIEKISNALKLRNKANNDSLSVKPLPIYEEGESLTALKVVPSAGIDPATGKEIFIKRDGSYTFTYDANDKVVFGDTAPLGFGSISSYLTYKNWSVSASMAYSFGAVAYNHTLVSRVEGASPVWNADERVFNDRWKELGNVAKYRDIADASTPLLSSRFVEKNNYLTLKSLSVGYEFEKKVLDKLKIKRLRLELLTNDLFYLSTIKQERGLEYPFARTVEMSLRFSL